MTTAAASASLSRGQHHLRRARRFAGYAIHEAMLGLRMIFSTSAAGAAVRSASDVLSGVSRILAALSAAIFERLGVALRWLLSGLPALLPITIVGAIGYCAILGLKWVGQNLGIVSDVLLAAFFIGLFLFALQAIVRALEAIGSGIKFEVGRVMDVSPASSIASSRAPVSQGSRFEIHPPLAVTQSSALPVEARGQWRTWGTRLWGMIGPVVVALALIALIGALVLKFGAFGVLWLGLAALFLVAARFAPWRDDSKHARLRWLSFTDAFSIVWLAVVGGIAIGLGLAAAVVSAVTVVVGVSGAAIILFARFALGAIVARAALVALAASRLASDKAKRRELEPKLRVLLTPAATVVCITTLGFLWGDVQSNRMRSGANVQAGPAASVTPPPPTTLGDIEMRADAAQQPLAFRFGFRSQLEGRDAAMPIEDVELGDVCAHTNLYALGSTSAAGSAVANQALARHRAIALADVVSRHASACRGDQRPMVVAVVLESPSGSEDRVQRTPRVVSQFDAIAKPGDARRPEALCLMSQGTAGPAQISTCPVWTKLPNGQ